MPHDLVPVTGNTHIIDTVDGIPPELADDLDFAHLLVKEELAESTRQGYARDMRLFGRWCLAHNVSPLPCTPASLAAYLASLVKVAKVRGSTLSRRVAAIRWAHKVANLPDPTVSADPAVRNAVRPLLKSARRRLGTAAVFRKSAITPDQLVAMLECCDTATLTGLRDKAALSLGWSLAMRRGELVALDLEDLQFVEGGLKLTIRRSKTDQEGAGATVALPDRVRDRIRAVRDVRAWLRAARIKNGPVFTRVNKGGGLQNRLDGGSIGLITKRYARLAGLDVESIGAHSLRIGFCTAAAAAGATAAQMMATTRHTSTDTLFSYIRSQNAIKDYPAAILR